MIDTFAELARLRPQIEAALERAGGTHGFTDIVSNIYRGNLQLWPGKQSAVVTEVMDAPLMRYVHIFLAGGDLDELTEMEKAICTWAREIGARRVTINGRTGWERALEGYQRAHVALAKELVE